MKWDYTIDKGLSSRDLSLDILFGMNRYNLRRNLSYDPEMNRGRFDNEDSYRKREDGRFCKRICGSV